MAIVRKRNTLLALLAALTAVAVTAAVLAVAANGALAQDPPAPPPLPGQTPTGTPDPNAPPTAPPQPGGSPAGTRDPNAPPAPPPLPGRTAAPTPTPTPTPQPPTDVEARNGERAGEVVLSWTPAGNPTFYRIGWLPYAEYEAARAADRPWLDAFAYQDVVNTDRRSRHTLKGLQPGVAYAFVVAPAGSRFGPTPSRTWSEWAVLTLHDPAECPDAENPSPTPIPSPIPSPTPTP